MQVIYEKEGEKICLASGFSTELVNARKTWNNAYKTSKERYSEPWIWSLAKMYSEMPQAFDT